MRRNTLLFIVLSVLASAFNYLSYPILSHILPSAQYVDVTVSLSLLTQVATFLSSIVAITVGLSKTSSENNAKIYVTFLQSLLLKFFVIMSVVFLLLSPIIMSSVHAPAIYAIPICLMLLASIPITVVSGYLNGKKLLVKLGLLTVISAGAQLLVAVAVGVLTQNGVAVVIGMSIAQLIVIFIIYKLYSNENLPHIIDALKAQPASMPQKEAGSLVKFTILASAAIMALNIAQIADLLVVQSLAGHEVRFYTDIYVVSRIVFFAGMILIWPFLSDIDMVLRRRNWIIFLKIVGAMLLLSLGAMIAMVFFGDAVTQLLFGVHYDTNRVQIISTLSITYKLLFLILTTITLYFMVFRHYAAVWISMSSCVVVAAVALSSSTMSVEQILYSLNATIAPVTSIAILMLFLHSRKGRA